jgi:hypothetical protein
MVRIGFGMTGQLAAVFTALVLLTAAAAVGYVLASTHGPSRRPHGFPHLARAGIDNPALVWSGICGTAT